MALPVKKLRDNIEKNIERANRQWHQDHKTEPPQSVKDHHSRMFRNAEVERERIENRKRGVK